MTKFKKILNNLEDIELGLKNSPKPDFVKTSVELTKLKSDIDDVIDKNENLILKIKREQIFRKLVKLSLVLILIISLYILL